MKHKLSPTLSSDQRDGISLSQLVAHGTSVFAHVFLRELLDDQGRFATVVFGVVLQAAADLLVVLVPKRMENTER